MGGISKSGGQDEHVIVPDRLAHIVLRTPDKRPLMDWYRDVLGARIVFENDFIGFLTYDSEHHRVAVIQMPDLTRAVPQAAGLHHVAWAAESRDDVDRLYAELLRVGARILDAPADYPQYGKGYYAVFFADPDGLKFEYVHVPGQTSG